ncbi:BLUF domain-containing protein [Hymenobacter latericus]|uniref:BLUF domain-containing protein n=1 Tax=Hymenobacter sp. YIM 151858-1 TaxID=2987688 RepID=UPI0022264A3A|nr:BLUF domain-containing protein [Hymenobacter sp. YIM 151858-1]UYZ60280.1 BLUF domain-containing protein [Hymenobacter sp. YIM 151858-1]
MNHIIYMSRAVRPLSDQDLHVLLEQCRRDNARLNVTGILFYSHGNIAQLIEGDSEQLNPLFERISRDGRHSHVQKLADKAITERSFVGWSMAFHPLEPQGFQELTEYLLPDALPESPQSLSIADALILDLVRQAVFGKSAVFTEGLDGSYRSRPV